MLSRSLDVSFGASSTRSKLRRRSASGASAMSRPSSDPLTCHGTPGVTSGRGTAHADRSRTSASFAPNPKSCRRETSSARRTVPSGSPTSAAYAIDGSACASRRVGELDERFGPCARRVSDPCRGRAGSARRPPFAPPRRRWAPASRQAASCLRRRARRAAGCRRRAPSSASPISCASSSAIVSAASARAATPSSIADVERRALLLLAHLLEALTLGRAEIEAVGLPLPRHPPGDRAVAGRRARHRGDDGELAGRPREGSPGAARRAASAPSPRRTRRCRSPARRRAARRASARPWRRASGRRSCARRSASAP